jgi:hypothetical protein
MVLDVIEDAGGRFQVWGKTDEGCTILVKVNDFQPYFYMATPTHQASLEHARLQLRCFLCQTLDAHWSIAHK